MLAPMLPAAVLLDMDGTLVDSEAVYTEAIARYMASKGVELDAREREFVIGHAWQDIYVELRVAERLGIELPAMIEGTISMRGPMREDGIDLTILDGARELVATLTRWLRTVPVPVHIVSGSPADPGSWDSRQSPNTGVQDQTNTSAPAPTASATQTSRRTGCCSLGFGGSAETATTCTPCTREGGGGGAPQPSQARSSIRT